MNNVIYGVPVPWYRLNGWIIQAGKFPGGQFNRWQFYVLGVVVVRTPWLFVGPPVPAGSSL